jgi:Raf kinase inhibitor-like YbhB/YbcL family protein
MTLQLSSLTFDMNEQIPERYTDIQTNISPPLNWNVPPDETTQFALICHDPDAPGPRGFTHWVIYGIPAITVDLEEGQPSDAYTRGTNSAGVSGYVAPAPPPGDAPHHYDFTLYALDLDQKLQPGMTREQLLSTIDKHILAQAHLVGLTGNR